MQLQVHLPGYENLKVEIDEKGFIKTYHLQGSTQTLALFQDLKKQYGNQLSQWPSWLASQPQLKHDASPAKRRSLLLLQELIAQAKGISKVPFAGEMVCDCRQVVCETIDQAIIARASSVEEVSAWTTACTSCTSCKDKIVTMINYRCLANTSSSDSSSNKAS